MKLVDLIPNPDTLYGLEPHELGLRMLPVLAHWPEENTSRHLTLDEYLLTVIGDVPRGLAGQYSQRDSRRVRDAIREAWAWLEGQALLIKRQGFGEQTSCRELSRSARKLAESPNPRRVLVGRRMPKEAFHPAIREDVWTLYHRGKYDTAVFEAMKAVEVAVREAAGLAAKDIGVSLMRKAFDKINGPLTDQKVEESERQARSDLFAGAIGSHKNPHSHRNVALDDPDETAEIIMLANHLLRIVDSRKSVAP